MSTVSFAKILCYSLWKKTPFGSFLLSLPLTFCVFVRLACHSSSVKSGVFYGAAGSKRALESNFVLLGFWFVCFVFCRLYFFECGRVKQNGLGA